MITVPAQGFSLEHFSSLADGRPNVGRNAVTRMEEPAEAACDPRRVKIGGGGGMPFARHAAVHDTGKVKIGQGGGAPFARR